MLRSIRTALAFATASFLLLSCGGGGGGGGGGGAPTPTPPVVTGTATGTVVDGPISGATVEIYDFTGNARGAKLGTGTSDSNGNYTITLTPRPTGPVVVVASGGSYTDDATGGLVNLGPSDQLTEIVPASSIVSGALSAHVNPLNHIAASLVTGTAGTLGVDNAIASAKGTLGQHYGISVTDLGTTPPVNASNPNPDTAPTLNQKQSGVVIAGLSQLAKNLNVRPIDLIKAIGDDYSDGKLDGMKGTAPITIPTVGGGTTPLQATTALGDLQTSINTFLGSDQNKSGLTVMPPIATIPIAAPTNNSGAVFAKSDMIPAFVTGQTSTFQLQAGGGSPPYTWMLAGACPVATVSSSGLLTATGASLPSGTSMTVSDPCEVFITDTRNQTAKLTFRITTIASAPSITTQGATVQTGKFAAVAIASATGGTPPYFFMKQAGAGLPPGMNVITSGDVQSAILSGTPTQAGFFQFNVCVADLGKTPNCASVAVTVNDPPKASLTIATGGTGTGSVTTLPQGSSCGTSCQSFPIGTQVTLTATPTTGSTFAGWSGGNCTGTSPCAVTLNANTTVTASFASSGGIAVSTLLKPNTLAIFAVSSGGTSSNLVGYDSGGNSLVVNSSLYYYSMIVPSTSQWVVLDQHTSVSYASSSISPFVQDDRVFQITDFGSGRTDLTELNLQTNKLGTQHMVGDASPGSLSLVGDKLFYRSKVVSDLFGTFGGQWKTMSTWQFGGTTTTLLQRTDADNQATFNVGDGGNVYAIKHDRLLVPKLTVNKRDLTTGKLSTLLRSLTFTQADGTLYSSIWSMKVNKGILYVVRKKISDGSFEILTTDLNIANTSQPLTLLRTYTIADGGFTVTESQWGVDDGRVALLVTSPGGSTIRRNRVLILESGSTTVLDLGANTSVYAISVLFKN